MLGHRPRLVGHAADAWRQAPTIAARLPSLRPTARRLRPATARDRIMSTIEAASAPNCATPRSSTTSSRRPARWRSARPSSWSTSAIWRWPIRPASPRRARRSSPTRRMPSATPRAATWWRSITNGTAVLGLGNIGPLAAKPVMEGKAVLFKKFAGIDVFDIEVDENEPRQAGRHHRRARADLRRHQPRRHQGARLLLRRARAARAHEDPGLPRRPARHRDRRRRGRAQRPEGDRQGHPTRSSWSPRAPARPRWPAWICWSSSACRARTSGSPTWPAWSTRAAPS